MPALMARLGGNQRAREQRIFSAYVAAVGEALARQTCADAVRGTTLFVRVSSSALAHQVTLLKTEILDRMAPLLDPGMVTDLRTRVGPLHAGGHPG